MQHARGRPHDAIVVGAGVAGLACATALADAGWRVLVLEARGAAGGRARSWRDEATGLDVDIGPHVVTTEHSQFLALLERLGTAGQVDWQAQPLIDLLDGQGHLVMHDSRAVPPLHGLRNLPAALTRLSLRDVLSHARIGWRAARETESTLRALDSQDALTLLRSQGVTGRAIEWFWRSALLALLNVPLEQCSAAAAMRVFRLAMGRSGWHFGFPKVGLSSLYVDGCEGAVRAAGGELRRRSVVDRIEREVDGTLHLALRDGARLETTRLVLALPARGVARLLGRSPIPELRPLARTAARFRGVPYQCTYLWFDRRVTLHRFWSRAWRPDDLGTDFYDLAALRPELADAGSVIACNAIGPHVRGGWTDEQVVARSREELAEFAPGAAHARLLHARVHRVSMAIPWPAPGTESLRPANATVVPGLFVAGDWTDTHVPCSMESAARSGMGAAGLLLGRALVLPPPETEGLVALVRRVIPLRAAAGRNTGVPSP